MFHTKNRSLLVFGILTFLFLIPFSALYIVRRENIFLVLLMCTPAASVLLTRLIVREGFGHLYLKPYFTGNIKWYLAAWLLTPFIAYFGALVYFLLFPQQFEPLASSFALQTGITSLEGYLSQLAVLIPLAIVINPIFGLLPCLGEEFAWRGYLLPKLCERMSVQKAVLLTGVIWGIWHAPIIAIGYNYDAAHPLLSILAMVLFCVVLGIIQGFLFLKCRSVWPAVVFHAAVNAIDNWTPTALFMSGPANAFLGPNLTGLIGGVGFILAAILLWPKLKQLSLS